jgi:hypothetical protein
MPRDGLSQYAPPPGTNGITNYTIESTKYNGFVADVTQDLNLPRPIVAGGTGASDAHTAMVNLNGEIAGQTVTNYDSFPFVAGSFNSAAGATSAPVAGHAFSGICYVYHSPDYMTIEARDINDANYPGRVYVRSMAAGVWAAWSVKAGSAADLDAAYVNVSGDTMTGPLNLVGGSHWSFASPGSGSWYASNTAADRFFLGSDATGDAFRLYAAGAAKNAFSVDGPSANVVFGNNISAFNISSIVTATTGLYYFGNTGTKYLSYDGSNYLVTGGNFQINGTAIVTNPGNGALGQINFGNSGTKSLSYDGTNFNLNGGQFVAANAIWSQTTTATGVFYFGNTGLRYLSYDGSNYVLNGSNLLVNSGQIDIFNTANYVLSDGTNMYLRVPPGGQVTASNSTNGGVVTFECGSIRAVGHTCRQGALGAYTGNVFNIYHTATQNVWIDGTNMGAIAYQSDYRIKKDVIDLPGMWDVVKGLRPIKYTQAQFSPPSHIEHLANEASKAREEAEANPDAKPREVSAAPLFEADDVERWGFIAHELQATLTPSAANGEKDSPDTIQSPNPFTLIAALTKALQEAMARIEALEAR